MCWTDSRNLFIELLLERFGCRWSIWTSFSDISRDVGMAAILRKKHKLPSLVVMMPLSCKKIFVNFGPVIPELTELIGERLVRHGQKTDIFSQISQDILDRFLVFTSWKHCGCRWSICTSFYVAIATKLFWEKRESNEGGLIPPAFFALEFENESDYHYLYVRKNSSDDATSDINLVGFQCIHSCTLYNRRRSAIG